MVTIFGAENPSEKMIEMWHASELTFVLGDHADEHRLDVTRTEGVGERQAVPFHFVGHCVTHDAMLKTGVMTNIMGLLWLCRSIFPSVVF